MKLLFEEREPLAGLRPWVRRVILGYSEEPVEESLPIRSTGFAYFTFTNRESGCSMNYEHVSKKIEDEINIVNQLTQNQAYLKFNGKVIHIGLEMLPTFPYHIFHLSGEELLNQGASFKSVNEKEYEELTSTIRRDMRYDRIGLVLQEYVLKKLQEKNLMLGEIEHVLQIIYDQYGQISVPELAKKVSLSERTFRRNFTKTIGLSPKYYAKIIQLNHVFNSIKTNNEKEIYQIALESGYYDQSHFINDFQKYIGQSPNNFLQSGHDFLRTYLGKVSFDPD